jgi:hypothetical protein
MTTPAQIEIESDAGRLLRAALAGAGWVDPPLSQEDAARWLVRKKYARWSGHTLYITFPHYDADGNRIPGPQTGQEYYARLCQNPSVTADAAAWKEEARSGLAVKPGILGTVTRRSEIDRAVIPSPSPPRTPRSPEDMAADNERMAAVRRKLLADLDCTEDELHRFEEEGRLKVCGHCEEWGVFDRDRGGWKPKCRRCRKGER